MSKFSKNKNKKSPAISTAALPDIVFMLLFFFMVATTPKDDNSMVQIAIPGAEECKKVEDKSLVAYINVGKPTSEFQGLYGKEMRMQLNDAIKELKHIPQFIDEKRSGIERTAPDKEKGKLLVKKMVVSLKVDQDCKNGMIDNIKQELRKVNALKVNYVVNNLGDE